MALLFCLGHQPQTAMASCLPNLMVLPNVVALFLLFTPINYCIVVPDGNKSYLLTYLLCLGWLDIFWKWGGGGSWKGWAQRPCLTKCRTHAVLCLGWLHTFWKSGGGGSCKGCTVPPAYAQSCPAVIWGVLQREERDREEPSTDFEILLMTDGWVHCTAAVLGFLLCNRAGATGYTQ